MYRAPIDILVSDIQYQIAEKQDEQIYKAVVSVGINVDKDELIRALKHDRNQYSKGYSDGKADATPRWIPVEERLPEEHDSIWANLYGTKSWQPGLFRKCSYDVIACVEKKDGSRRVISIRTYDGKWAHNKLNEETVICWQPMPQPPKGE